MNVGLKFTAEKECPICERKFKVTKLRSRLVKIRQDIDLCMYYEDINPYYYTIWVCPHCGYANDEKNFSNLREANVTKIKAFLAGKEVKLEYVETRKWVDAVASYKLAIFFADLIEAPPSRLAGMYLKLAWLYREQKNQEEEHALLRRAIAYYDQSLAKERYPVGPMTDTTVTYLIGALHKLTGNLDDATMYLSRVVGDQRARLEPMIYNMARDLWQDIRTEKETAAAEATPDEKKK